MEEVVKTAENTVTNDININNDMHINNDLKINTSNSANVNNTIDRNVKDNVIISVQNIRKVYKLGSEKVIALDCINLDIYKGEIVCIFGTSGSGKSTLLNMLAGLEKPTKGCVMIGQTNISKLNEDQLAIFRQRHIGFVFQSYNLINIMSSLDNVALPLMFKGMSRAKRHSEAKRMLKEVGLYDRMNHKPNQMSGGQQQRVGIARAFVANPKIVFADEPTGNLDSKTTKDIMAIMCRMSELHNQTIILVSHDPDIAGYADRIVKLKDGNIVTIEKGTRKYKAREEKNEEA